MAHYANDCWDGEIETSYGWVECVGLADRSAYDLTAHAKMSKIELTAHEKFAEPRMVDQLKVLQKGDIISVKASGDRPKRCLLDFLPYNPPPQIAPNRKEIGVAFKKEAKAVTEYLEGMAECDALELKVTGGIDQR